MYETCESFGYWFLDDVPEPPIQLRSVGVEERASEEYYFDNSDRESMYVFQYTLSGSGFYWDGKQTYEVKTGQAFFVKTPSNTAYYYRNNGAPWKFLFITLRGNYVEEYYQRIISAHTSVFYLNPDCTTIRVINHIYQLAQLQEISQPFAASSLAVEFLMNLCMEDATEEYTLLINHAVRIFNDEFSTLNGIDEAADRLHVSLSHLCREFSRQTGTTCVVYLTKVRLRYSANLLLKTSLRIEEIAQKSGFANGNYFSKVFRKYIGCSPNEFRNNPEMNWSSITL